MNQEQSRRLISETFHNDFSKERFIPFIKEFLSGFDDGKKFPPRTGAYIRAAFRERVASYERIGQFTDRDGKIVDVLVINLNRQTTLNRGRTGLRNFIADYLTNTEQGIGKSAVLAAYVSPDRSDWRFSFVTLETELAQNEKGKFKEEIASITPARRKSFLVGKDEKTHTAQSRFLKWLESSQNPTLTEIEACFDVESVTKEFFQKYKQLFEKTRDAILEFCERDKKVRAEFIAKGMSVTVEDENGNKIKKPYADDFAKKLLGQIVFLYFLQKKGWFGVNRGENWGDGDKEFLRSIFKNREKYRPHNLKRELNFYEDILEPLFYNTLAIKRANDWSDRFHCKIPFLNGGLFEAIYGYDWSEFELLLPDTLFSNKRNEADEGDGILDVFDLYNFTINEAEPLETEVAVDPEMLGKIFENLLPENIRHGSGTYYTPRVIVAYMCQQSLINYLATHLTDIPREDIETLIRFGAQAADYTTGGTIKDADKFLPEAVVNHAEQIDKLLQKITVCDPAIGSGAFPVGMMQEIVRAREALQVVEIMSRVSQYELKRQTIENSLYGVDIDPGAVEIAKLRLWLSLIVDEVDFQEIEPLPNLDYKIMQGNSLLDAFHGVKLIDEKMFEQKTFDREARIAEINKEIENLQIELGGANVGRNSSMYVLTERRISELKKEKAMLADGAAALQFGLYADEKDESQIKLDNLKAKIKQFFGATDKDKKDRLRDEIENLEWEFIEAKLLADGKSEEIDSLAEAQKERRKNYFLWQLNFPEIFQNGGFDIMIANPPYIGEVGNKAIFSEVRTGSLGKFYQRKMDYFYFFINLCLDINSKICITSFITTNYYLTADGAYNLRKHINSKSLILELINFNEYKIFESAKGQHNIITILNSNGKDNKNCLSSITKRKGGFENRIIKSILSGNDNETDYYQVTQQDIFDGEKLYIRQTNLDESSNIKTSVLNHIQNIGERLDKFYSVSQGLLSGIDRITNKHIKENLVSNEQLGKGVYVLTPKELVSLNVSESELKIIKPYFKNSDINKYVVNEKPKYYLIYATREINIEEFPNIKKHFILYKEAINNRSRDRGEMQAALKQGKWWVIFAVRNQSVFDSEKIVCPQRSYSNVFGYTNKPWYGGTDIYFITKNNSSLKYLLAILNSKLIYFWLYNRGKRKGEMLEIFYTPLTEIPIVMASDVSPFENLIDQIIESKKDDSQTDTSHFEKQIDDLVYRLYKLTPDEIAVIEGENSF